MEDFSEVSAMEKSAEQILEDDFPIHVACKEGNLKFLEEAVLKATFTQMTQEDIVYGWQPIHWAAFHGQLEVLCGLIRGGIDKDIRTSRYHQAPAHLASFGGHKDVAQALIQMHADINIQDSLGETPLHKAARSGDVDMVITFIRGGADMTLCNKTGHTALDMARQHKFERCVQALNNPEMLLQTNGTNGAHLHTAVQNGSSGAQVTNGNHHNGHGNGQQQHQNGVEAFHARKRNCDSEAECEAMSRNKRMRTAEASSQMSHSAVANNNNNDRQTKNETQQQQPMMSNPAEAEAATASDYEDFITRPPSPGMDMILHNPCNDDDELVNWGHFHGYGDTAEAMPDDFAAYHEGHEDKPPQSVESCATSTSDEGDGGNNAANFRSKLRGVQARGWAY